jgi:hypothetical protein
MKYLNLILNETKSQLLFILIVWVLLFLFYYPAHNAMLIDDGVSGLFEIKTKGITGYIDSYGFGSFYYGHYLFLIIINAIFGSNNLGWFAVFTLMHAVNTFLIFKTFYKSYSSLHINNNNALMAFCGSLLFLCSSYQSENIAWAATSHYAISLMILLLSIYFLIQFFQHQKTIFPLAVLYLLFGFNLVTLEISFIYPVMYCLLYVLFFVFNKNNCKAINFFKKILLPHCMLILVYFIFYKLRRGMWLPDDRAPLGTVVPIQDLFIHFIQHIVKLFGFVHYLPFPKREAIYQFCLHWKKIGFLSTSLFLVLSYWMYKRGDKKIILFLFLFAFGVMMYAPFLRLYFMYLARIENDRYSYFGSVVFFQLFVFTVFQFRRAISFFFISNYICLFIYFNIQNITARHMSANMNEAFLNNYPQNITGKTFLLNVPVSCADAYIYRSDARFPIAYRIKFNKNLEPLPIQIAAYNAQSFSDSIVVNKIDSLTYQVQLKANGTWWRDNNSMGAANYETTDYSFVLDEWGAYIIKFKNKLNNTDAVLLFDGHKFIKVNTF